MIKQVRIVSRLRHRGRHIHGCVFHYNHSIFHGGMQIEYADGVEGLDDDYPLGILHPWSTDSGTSKIPVGSVRFYSVPGVGLYFRGIISNTPAGNDALTLVRDRALLSVSIAIENLEHTHSADGYIIVTRSKPYELSLCPTGMGAFPEARIS